MLHQLLGIIMFYEPPLFHNPAPYLGSTILLLTLAPQPCSVPRLHNPAPYLTSTTLLPTSAPQHWSLPPLLNPAPYLGSTTLLPTSAPQPCSLHKDSHVHNQFYRFYDHNTCMYFYLYKTYLLIILAYVLLHMPFITRI